MSALLDALPKTVRYVKNGAGGQWWTTAKASGQVHLGWSGILPYAFTEQGVAMLSSVLRSDRAAEVNVAIVRTFVKLRQMLATNQELARKVREHEQKITVLVDAVQKLLALPAPKKNPIGYVPSED